MQNQFSSEDCQVTTYHIESKLRSFLSIIFQGNFCLGVRMRMPHCQKPQISHIWLTHWGWDKMDAIFQTTFSNGFSWMKMYEFFIKISLKFVSKGLVNNIPALVQIMACRRPGDKPLSEPMMVRLLTQICVARPQLVNTKVSECLKYWSHVNKKVTIEYKTHNYEKCKFFKKWSQWAKT